MHTGLFFCTRLGTVCMSGIHGGYNKRTMDFVGLGFLLITQPEQVKRRKQVLNENKMFST